MNFIISGLFIFFIVLVGLIPFRLLYVFSDFTRFLLYRVIGYRKKVVDQNLRQSFPDWDEDQLRKVTHNTYKNLTDIFIEGIKTFTLSGKNAAKRYKILNPELLEKYYHQNKSIIFVLGHYGNWEWGTLGVPLQVIYDEMVILYKPLSNQYIDRYIRKTRSRTGASLVSIYQTAESFKRQKEKPAIFVLVADQSPGNSKNVIWTQFLGQDTAFLQGPEKYATALDLPVIYVDIQRAKRGYYELELSVLCERPRELTKGELTKMYAQKLESIIQEHPDDWLWSHRRWKLKRNKK
ncbi:MAG: lysophospholipid acyltransferase family protein [Bacteroidales bacterium]|nr:lysophospholipid acyltransferase family protein [Bacteroidales bacterium]